jgi:hypothetical protein
MHDVLSSWCDGASQAVALLNNQADLPNSIAPDAPTKTVQNPF